MFGPAASPSKKLIHQRQRRGQLKYNPRSQTYSYIPSTAHGDRRAHRFLQPSPEGLRTLNAEPSPLWGGLGRGLSAAETSLDTPQPSSLHREGVQPRHARLKKSCPRFPDPTYTPPHRSSRKGPCSYRSFTGRAGGAAAGLPGRDRPGSPRRVHPRALSPLRDVASLHGGGVASATRLCCRRLRASRKAGGMSRRGRVDELG